MSDALLPYYNRELDAIRRLAAEFALSHPKIAGRLRLSPDSVDDPHVARLLEGVAFLAARAPSEAFASRPSSPRVHDSPCCGV